ncbi:UNVERIFIED_CONTAM: Myosin type-2 heavy chain 1 [Siphonaria sp. JEL0065]|nr:Myosin type-2 heavy chain 1 [Siphonaria sp. JEL0065]
MATDGFDVAKALLDYRQGTQAYFVHSSEGWIVGQVTEDAQIVDGSSLYIPFKLSSSGDAHIFKAVIESLSSNADLPHLKNPDFLDNVEDLSLLSHLHEPAVFYGIKNRFSETQIYTYSGMVLISMNPFRNVDLYSVDVMRRYAGSKRKDAEPHIYGIAEECYQAMLQGKNQSVIVSGESGAGKTESTKYIMQYLAIVDSLQTVDSKIVASVQGNVQWLSMMGVEQSGTEEAVLASNPILEAFGNAKTTRNDNSSRFGKFVELIFSDPVSEDSVRITGARIRTYLLERSRLIFQPKNERNYHIFYQLCAAAPDSRKRELELDSWDSFYYLSQGQCGVVDNVSDHDEFQQTLDALSLLGIAESVQWNIFRICAALLHIGNISISASETDGSIIDPADPALEKAAELLGINKTEFVTWVTKKQTIVGREKYVKDVKVEMALVSRDSVTKVIYAKLFDWLVLAINSNLKRNSSAEQKCIGVLDIYGFEHFTKNSFEQFCINYANEKLQQEFNAHVFRNTQSEYISEGIQWKMIEYRDNQKCIDLIESKVGILGLLDEESRLPNGSESSFVAKLNNNLGGHQYFSKARFGTTDFTVRHYAVDVTYTSVGLIDKNKDLLGDELLQVLADSTDPFLQEVFASSERAALEEAALKKKGERRGTMTAPTLGSMFKSSLQELMTRIGETESHYIRCIKPNTAKSAFEFEGAMVLSQLKACGILETIKISNAGYPNKMAYPQFASRYKLLVHSSFWPTLTDKEISIQIVASVISDSSKYQFGKTKVFFKSGQIAFFEDRRRDRIHYLATVVQKNVRRFLEQRRFERMKEAVVVMQAVARGWRDRKRFILLKIWAVAKVVHIGDVTSAYRYMRHVETEIQLLETASKRVFVVSL